MPRIPAALLVTLLAALAAPGAHAATFVVNGNADTTDGACSTEPAGCTLREAIEAVVATPGRDTIRFDASVFPQGTFSQAIVLTSALPVIADPAGTVVDGAGAGVFITGGMSPASTGLVFASGAGMPLAKVTVANLLIGNTTGALVHVCGGEPPACDEDVSDTLVQRVVANLTATGDGIRIEGRNVRKTRVVESIGFHTGGSGIRVSADAAIVGWRLERCTVRACDQRAVSVLADGDIVGGTIVDTTVVDNGGGIGILAGGQVAKAKLTNVASLVNMTPGIFIRGNAGIAGIAIADTIASGNTEGIAFDAPSVTAPKLTNVVVDHHFAQGVEFNGETSAAKISRLAAVANGATGLAMPDNTLGASLAAVVSAANGADGLLISGSASSLKTIRADANGGNGILLTPLQNGLSGTSSGNTVQKSVTNANDSHGIFIATGTTESQVKKNVALGNGDDDYRDGNPSCDANVWSANTFRIATDPCIQ